MVSSSAGPLVAHIRNAIAGADTDSSVETPVWLLKMAADALARSQGFPELPAAQHAFNAGWASALDYTNQSYPSPRVLAQAYQRYVASELMFPSATKEPR